jgi:hypothetical protein
MANDEESLMLAFKESGVEFIEEAGKAVGDLGDKMKDLDKAGQEAIDVLKSEGTVVQDLRDKIQDQKRSLEALADAHKAGLMEQSRYKEKSDELIHSLRENETVLKRLTAGETESQAAFKTLTDEIEKQAAAEEKAAIAADKLAMEANRNLIQEQERLDAIVLKNQASLEAMAGKGEGESGKGGFAGAAAGAMKAEKAVHSLASGTGLGRLGSMLEGVLGPMGIPGLGMALGALAYELEPLIPKIKAFVDAWETGIKPLNETTEAIERLNRAQGESRQKRALSRVEAKITALEDEEDTQGWLAPNKQVELRKLREAASNIEQEFALEKAAEDRKKREKKAELTHIREQEAGAKTIADVEEKTKRLMEKRDEKQLERDDILAELEIEQNDPDQQFMERQKARRTLHNQQIDEDNRKLKEKRRADAETKRHARENTPEAIEHRALTAQRNEEMDTARQVQSARANQGDTMAAQMGPQELNQVVSAVGRNRLMNSQLGFTLAQQVDYYMGQLEAKMVADFARGMGQQNRPAQNTMPFGGF